MIKWYKIIFGAIDGPSLLLVFLECIDNNKASSIMSCFYAILDPFNEIDLVALHYAQIPLMKEKLDLWHDAWSKHRIHTVKSPPLKLWVSGQINCPLEVELTDQEQYFYGVKGVINEAAVDKARSIYSSTTSDIINGDLLEQLRLKKSFNSLPKNYDIQKFMEVKNLEEPRSKYKFFKNNIHLYI